MRKHFLYLFICVVFSLNGLTQTDTISEQNATQSDEVHISEYPVFPGCEDVLEEERMSCMGIHMIKEISKKLKYPKDAANLGVEGKIVIQFVIEKDGSYSSFMIKSNSAPQKSKKKKNQEAHTAAREALEKAAIDAVKTLPACPVPGKQDGDPVRVYLSVPITFNLN